MYLTHNEGTSVVAERFNRTFKKTKFMNMGLLQKTMF